MKNFYLLILLFLIFSCQLDNEPEIEASTEIEIVDASNEHKDVFDGWMGQGAHARISKDYNTEDLVRITDGELSRWAVPSNNDPNTSLSFVFDPYNNIRKPFISTSIRNPDASISSKIFDMQNQLVMEIVHKPDGSVEVINKGTPATLGWWAEFEYCFDKVMNPFPSTVANVAAGLVFQAATYNLWIPSVALVCSGVAFGRNHQNKN